MKRKDRDDRIYCSTVNYDQFSGFSVPSSMGYIIDYIRETTGDDFIDLVFDDYDDYRDYEVECASQARHGSAGTDYYDTPEEFMKDWNRTINKNEKLKKFFEGICKPIVEEPVVRYSGGGITGCTY